MKIEKPIVISQGFMILFSLLFGTFSYYFASPGMDPFLSDPSILPALSRYQLYFQAPLTTMVAFSVLLAPLMSSKPNGTQKLGFLLAGVGNLFLGLLLCHSIQYGLRVLAPRAGDDRAGLWIQKGEVFTALGELKLGFGILPGWYLFAGVCVIFLFIASKTLVVSGAEQKKK